MQKVSERLARVGRVVEQVGVKRFAREAGVPPSTIYSYIERGWTHQYLPICDKLIAAADRIERRRRPPSAA
jgi:hypothetical protein